MTHPHEQQMLLYLEEEKAERDLERDRGEILHNTSKATHDACTIIKNHKGKKHLHKQLGKVVWFEVI